VLIAHNHHEESIFQNLMEGNDHWGLRRLLYNAPPQSRFRMPF
jgi:hypothetical protein